MASGGGCPPWIDPGSAFRLLVKVDRYVAEDKYGLVSMAEQQHDVWFDRNSQYSLTQLHEDLSSKFIWGPSQTLAVWAVDSDSGSLLKLRRDEHVHQMIKDRWEQRVAFLNVEVVRKGVVDDNAGSAASRATRQVRCPNCKEYGHRASSWKCPHTGTKKRKRTRKTTTKAGRKKAKKGTSADATLTPRTRGALAREAAAKARREAEEAELKAVTAREAAQAAAREELQATRDEFEANFALEVVPQTFNQSPAARRALFPQDELPTEAVPKKITPKRKQLATKRKKTPKK